MTLDLRTSEWYICKGITRFRKTTVRWLEQPPMMLLVTRY